MKVQAKNKALFLDRDGTLNIENNYVYKIEDFKFIEGILDVIKSYQEKGFLIFIISNQSGIARGFYTENEYLILTKWIIAKLEDYGIHITKVYHCPHHPDFTGECDCRKPKPGMILKAIHEFNINPSESVLIGDKKSDILAGKNAKIGKNLFIQHLLGKGE
ncbi:MAG: HAD family hydrolase [Prolixibacteraceae bacterium]|nr:HAD family hydrolase [Prolixibacteraceae bacterium]